MNKKKLKNTKGIIEEKIFEIYQTVKQQGIQMDSLLKKRSRGG